MIISSRSSALTPPLTQYASRARWTSRAADGSTAAARSSQARIRIIVVSVAARPGTRRPSSSSTVGRSAAARRNHQRARAVGAHDAERAPPGRPLRGARSARRRSAPRGAPRRAPGRRETLRAPPLRRAPRPRPRSRVPSRAQPRAPARRRGSRRTTTATGRPASAWNGPPSSVRPPTGNAASRPLLRTSRSSRRSRASEATRSSPRATSSVHESAESRRGRLHQPPQMPGLDAKRLLHRFEPELAKLRRGETRLVHEWQPGDPQRPASSSTKSAASSLPRPTASAAAVSSAGPRSASRCRSRAGSAGRYRLPFRARFSRPRGTSAGRGALAARAGERLQPRRHAAVHGVGRVSARCIRSARGHAGEQFDGFIHVRTA